MISNINTYKFIPLDNLAELREELLAITQSLELKGTILLSPEGINVNLAGPPKSINTFISCFRQKPGFDDCHFKLSESDTIPFKKLLVKIKKEIITFHAPDIKPHEYTSPRISPSELKTWYEQGEDFVVLDTRNDFEVNFGTFKNAIHFNIKNFTEFQASIKQLDPTLKNKPIVTFCTGGVRCEKAAPLMEQEGFTEVYQLDGGILNYFEQCGDAFYKGDCFVFDERVALNAQNQPSSMQRCKNCSNPTLHAPYCNACLTKKGTHHEH